MSKITKYDVVVGAIIAGTCYGFYKFLNWSIESDRKNREAREAERKAYEEYLDLMLREKDYAKLIRDASTFNKHLDAHQRNLAYDMLNNLMYEITTLDFEKNTLDKHLNKLNTYLDILLGDDEVAILATIDRQLRAEESKKIRLQREHELAMVKAAGEKELNLAKIAAEAETNKATLYSEGIRGAAEILKEVTTNERNEKSED